MLVEGMSMRSLTRLIGVSINTVTKLLRDAGAAADAYHHEHVLGVKGRRHVQCDEIWSFVYGKEGNVERMKSPPPEAGDVWTFTAIDTDSKLILSYVVVGPCGGRTALDFMDDIRGRVDDRPQISTDGLKAYVEAVDEAFGATADFAQIIETYYGRPKGVDDERRYSPAICSGIEKTAMRGQPDMRKANTSHVERHNLTIRMSNGGSRGSPTYSRRSWRTTARCSRSASALQLLPPEQDHAGHADDGGGDRDDLPGPRMDRRADRRDGARTGPPGAPARKRTQNETLPASAARINS